VSELLNIKYLYFLHMRSCKLCIIYSKYVRAIYSRPTHVMCKPHEAGMIRDFIKSTNTVLGSVMYCGRLPYNSVTCNVIKLWHIHHPSYKRQYHNTTQTARQVCHSLLTSRQVLHSLVVYHVTTCSDNINIYSIVFCPNSFNKNWTVSLIIH